MLLKVFSVYDSKVGAYLPPMFFRSKLEAIRAFSSAAAKEDHDFHRYAEDFTLFELGDWDDSNGQYSSLPTAISLGKAIEFINIETNYGSTVDRSLPLASVN